MTNYLSFVLKYIADKNDLMVTVLIQRNTRTSLVKKFDIKENGQ
jgi:hypothetical protein